LRNYFTLCIVSTLTIRAIEVFKPWGCSFFRTAEWITCLDETLDPIITKCLADPFTPRTRPVDTPLCVVDEFHNDIFRLIKNLKQSIDLSAHFDADCSALFFAHHSPFKI